MNNVVFLFPGQGAQYPGMGQAFADAYSIAKETFEEANDLLNRDLQTIVFHGPEKVLQETANSQVGIYVTSIALLRVIHFLFPTLQPKCVAGLSLGEYSAYTASGKLEFTEALPLVQHRAHFMNDACIANHGAMAVVLGLDAEIVEEEVARLKLPQDLWAANFNCPGQVVISGTEKGIDIGAQAMKKLGAKRVMPLPVHGAFHSGLMREAQERLAPHINEARFKSSNVDLVANVTAQIPATIEEQKKTLIEQVTAPVRWEQSIQLIDQLGVALYLEIGPGKALAGFNKRINTGGTTLSIAHPDDLQQLEEVLNEM